MVYDAAACLAAINERTTDGRSRFASFLEIPEIDENTPVNKDLAFWLKTELDNPLIPNMIEPVMDKMVEGLLTKSLTRHLISLFSFGGWYGGSALLEYLHEKLEAGGRNLGDSTLKTFFEHTGRDLTVVASDVTGKDMLVLNHRTAPNLPTIWAVRMSMSCPFVWQEVVWQEGWGMYRGCEIAGHVVVDGGLLSNFPIKLFLSNDEEADEMMGKDSAQGNVIGLLLDDHTMVPGAENTERTDSAPGLLERSDLVALMMNRIMGMAETALSARDLSTIYTYQDMICKLPAGGYGLLEFDLTPERMAPILQAGEAAMEAHLKGRFLGQL